MFEFLRRSAPRPLSDAIRHAIEIDGMTPPNPSRLRMVEVGGRYSDRKVTYFRVFDPSSAAEQTFDIRRYKDLDVYPELVVRAGHVERDGTVVLARPANVQDMQPTVRTRAGRLVPNIDAAVVEAETATTGPQTANAPLPGPTT